jgi:DNA-binding PadR family transcriptional regulator
LLSTDEPEKLSEKKDNRLPFDGLLGDSIHLKVLANLIAEPCRQYRIVDIAEEIESNPGTVSRVMRTLEDLGFVEEVVPGAKHPVYRVNCESNKLMALTILALAIRDDRDGSELMNDTIKHYCQNILNISAGEIRFRTSESQKTKEDPTYKTSSFKGPLRLRGGQA